MRKDILKFTRGSASAAVATLALTLALAHPAAAGGWTGGYVGGHLGYGTLDDVGDLDLDGFLGGIHGGYNFNVGSSFLLGIEGDISFLSAEHKETMTIINIPVQLKASVDFLASLRGRIGVEASENLLLYATAGIAWSEAEAVATASAMGQTATVKLSETGSGYVVGGGAEMKFSQSMSARAEVLHYGFDDDLDYDSTSIRGGLTLHFQ